MIRNGAERSAKRGSLFVGFVAFMVMAVAAASPADARGSRRGLKKVGGYAPPSAAIVVDSKTGKVLYGQNEDAPRIPASITKVMTLYLLFEQLERGRMRLDTPLTVSAHASAQPATKLGLRTGSTIEVEDAIKGMVTLSANDASVVVAENIAGSEKAFADMMTRKARALGMSNTSFYNANGLPNVPPNITTARDLATLGRAIQDRFPKYFAYFQTRSFQFGERTINGHNRLLGRIDGVDGIKTGYTRLSGFNLLTSVNTDTRSIVGVVLGGRSGGSRDAQMASMIEANLSRAYAGNRTAPMVAEASERARPAVVAAADVGETASTTPVSRPRARLADDADVKAVAYAPTEAPRAPLALQDIKPVQASVLPQTSTPSGLRWKAGPQAVADLSKADLSKKDDAKADARAELRQQIARLEAPKPEPVADTRKGPSGWVIQLGATAEESKAKDILADAKSRSKGTLAKAAPVTEKLVKGGETLYRARFSGFPEADDAEAACKVLKKSGFACFATRG